MSLQCHLQLVCASTPPATHADTNNAERKTNELHRLVPITEQAERSFIRRLEEGRGEEPGARDEGAK